MTFKDLTKLWEKYKEKYGAEAYRHISDLLKEAKELHRRDFLKKPTLGEITSNPGDLSRVKTSRSLLCI